MPGIGAAKRKSPLSQRVPNFGFGFLGIILALGVVGALFAFSLGGGGGNSPGASDGVSSLFGPDSPSGVADDTQAQAGLGTAITAVQSLETQPGASPATVNAVSLQNAEPTQHFTEGPSTSSSVVSVASTASSVTLAAHSSSGTCFYVWIGSGTTWYGSQPSRQTCQAPSLPQMPSASTPSASAIGWSDTGSYPHA